jgi:hypothetical protein
LSPVAAAVVALQAMVAHLLAAALADSFLAR